MRQLALLGLALLCIATIGGCHYGGLAVAPDGKSIYVARNGLMNLGRRIHYCSLNDFGDIVECRTTEAP